MKSKEIKLIKHQVVGDLIVYKNEPIIRFLFFMKLTPLSIGLLFFFVISLTLTLAGTFTAANENVNNYIGYWKNISWSVSILFIFPFVIGLTAKYYQEIPKLFERLSENIRSERESELSEFTELIDKKINSKIWPFSLFLIIIALNYVYYIQILDKEPYLTWITNGYLFKDIFNTKSGFSYSGLYSACIQVVLIYWVFSVVLKSFIFSWALFLFFNKYEFEVDIKPLHEDKCCGLKGIGNVGMIFNTILFLIGIYVSLKVIDKTVIQGLPITNDIGNPIFLGCYAFLAPLLFFFPLSAPHKKMKRMKQDFLSPLILQYSERINRLRNNPKIDNKYEEIEKLGVLIQKLENQIPVWPFNFKSLESFFATVIVPILPIVLPFLVEAVICIINNVFL